VDECKPLESGVPAHRRRRGRAVQLHPIKPKLKPPGSKRLKLKCDVLLSTFGFKFNSRRYTVVFRCDAVLLLAPVVGPKP